MISARAGVKQMYTKDGNQRTAASVCLQITGRGRVLINGRPLFYCSSGATAAVRSPR